jgi:putative transposase
MLCPLLTSEDVVVLDNATFHKSAETARLIAASGAQLWYLPPYSPDLNSIEHDFAALKKRREYNPETSLDEIVKDYLSSWA